MQTTKTNFSIVASTLFLLASLGVFAEEQSVLIGARVGMYDLSWGYEWNDHAIIDGNFKSITIMSYNDINGDGSKEMKIILTNKQKLITVFVSNRVASQMHNYRIGKSRIFAGDDHSNFSSNVVECS